MSLVTIKSLAGLGQMTRAAMARRLSPGWSPSTRIQRGMPIIRSAVRGYVPFWKRKKLPSGMYERDIPRTPQEIRHGVPAGHYAKTAVELDTRLRQIEKIARKREQDNIRRARQSRWGAGLRARQALLAPAEHRELRQMIFQERLPGIQQTVQERITQKLPEVITGHKDVIKYQVPAAMPSDAAPSLIIGDGESARVTSALRRMGIS